MDLSQMGAEKALESKALDNLKRNMSHLLISSIEEGGPEIDFGERGVLVFKPRVPSTAMLELVSNENKIDGLRNYIRIALTPESRPVFDEVLDDIPMEGLNEIVEFLSEATTSFPTK